MLGAALLVESNLKIALIGKSIMKKASFPTQFHFYHECLYKRLFTSDTTRFSLYSRYKMILKFCIRNVII